MPFNCFPASLFILLDVQSHENLLNCEETSFASLIRDAAVQFRTLVRT